METMVRKYQHRFRKVSDEMNRWDELQVRLISQFKNASSIIERLQALQDHSNYGSLTCVHGIRDALITKQMESLELILFSMKKTIEEFSGMVISLEKIHRDSKQIVKGGGSSHPSMKQLHLRVA